MENKNIPNWLLQVFGWINRQELADSSLPTASQIFQQICWQKLHGDVVPHHCNYTRKITYNYDEEGSNGGHPRAIFNDDAYLRILLLPIVPPPEYILGFSLLKIKFLDGHVLQFVQNIVPLLENIRLHLRFKIKESNHPIQQIHRLLAILAPKTNCLKTSSENLALFNRIFPGFLDQFRAIMLDAEWIEGQNGLLHEWLKRGRSDGRPKFLSIPFNSMTYHDHELDFIVHLREDFCTATKASTYIYQFKEFQWRNMVEHFTRANLITREVFSVHNRGHSTYLIRHPHFIKADEILNEYCAANNSNGNEVIVKIKQFGNF